MRTINALKALKNRWFISLLLLIQFTFGLSIITGSINIFYNFFSLHNHSLLDLSSTYLLTSYDPTIKTYEEKFNTDQLNQIYDKIQKHKDVISYGTYYDDKIPISTSTRTLNKKMLADLTTTIFGLNQPEINAIVIDENYNRLLNLQVEEGKNFSKKSFTSKRSGKINILVGPYFKKYFRLGDVINNQYTIIGFLPKDRYIVNNNSTNTYLKLDKAAIIPMSQDIYNDYGNMFLRFHQSTVLKLRPNADIDALNQLVQLKGDTLKMYLKNLGQDIHQNITDSTYSEIPQILLGACFIFFSVTGIVMATILSIIIRKREFGIKLVLGESKSGLFYQIFLENLLIGIAGTILSFFYFIWKYQKLLKISHDLNVVSVLDFKFNMPILFLVFLFLFIIILISNFVIFIFFKKLEPKSLIGGME
ncbi:ABC transporter permease [Rummeliibacillus suwonensis]|uniref:ABC transporter permease n=1 Tax=Rummeliibacillus suwonensis TaxID=1306154 RepID=UPI001AAE30C3|nr:ABC transporter permease [Rummeliibacillus suwonensis]MBO2535218.1 ABC transporter permease [Rummeliibacillus suwonensis]